MIAAIFTALAAATALTLADSALRLRDAFTRYGRLQS